MQPLERTLAVLDLSQNLRRCAVRNDGCVPTAATNSVMYSLRDGRSLSVPMMAKLMGRSVADIKSQTTATQFKHMLGMSFHPACSASLIACFLAAVAEGRDDPLL